MLTPEQIEELAGPFVQPLGGGPWVTGEDGIREFEIEDFARAVEAAATAEARALAWELPSGWALVPVESTDAMEEAGGRHVYKPTHAGDCEQVWRAMVKAAPVAPVPTTAPEETAATIRQLVEALENSSDLIFKDVRLSHLRSLALQAGRAWLGEAQKPMSDFRTLPACEAQKGAGHGT